MIASVKHKPGQSIYDLCLMTYQSFDLLIKLCVDNNVASLANIPQQVEYFYDTTLVKNKGIKDYAFTTDKDNAGSERIFNDAFGVEFG